MARVQEWSLRQRAAGRTVISVHHANKTGSGGTVRATIDDAPVRQASDALQQASIFLSNVTDLPPFQEGHQWFTSTLHALDHVGRLAEALDEIAKTRLATDGLDGISRTSSQPITSDVGSRL